MHYTRLKTESEEITSLTDVSYQSLVTSKTIRIELGGGDHHAEECDSNPIPSYDPLLHGYHRQCYQQFTKAIITISEDTHLLQQNHQTIFFQTHAEYVTDM